MRIFFDTDRGGCLECCMCRSRAQAVTRPVRGRRCTNLLQLPPGWWALEIEENRAEPVCPSCADKQAPNS